MGFFETVINFFQALWSYITNIISMLGYAVTMVLGGLQGTTILLTYMPAVIGGCGLTVVAVLIVRFLLMK